MAETDNPSLFDKVLAFLQEPLGMGIGALAIGVILYVVVL